MTKETPGTPPWTITVQVTYTKGKDRGVSLHLPVYPCTTEAWREGVSA